jgi:IclR family KDG regulon transcriptional repressor
VKTVIKAMAVLKTVASEDRGWGVTELSRQTGIDKAIVHRLLRTLIPDDLVVQEAGTRRYRLGPALKHFGRVGSMRARLIEVAQPIVTALAEETGETAYMTLRRGLETEVVAFRESHEMVRVVSTLAHRAPLHCSATGKAFLAFDVPSLLDMSIEHGLVRHSRSTITDPDVLRAAVAHIAAQGWSEEDEEFHDNVRGVAAPIKGHDGKIVGCIAVRGPSIRVTRAELPWLAERTLAAAAAISKQISAADSGPARGV